MRPQVRETIDAVWELCRQADDALNVPREGAAFLYATAMAVGATRILEVGTSYGFSGLHLAAAARANGGRLTTVDKSERKFAAAGEHFARAGLADVVTQHQGGGLDVLPTLEGPFDLVFLDAIKSETLGYFQAIESKLAERAVVITDNLTTHNEAAFGDFLPHIRSRNDFVSVTVPVGNGFEYSVRVDSA